MQKEQTRFKTNDVLLRAAVVVATVSGLFCLVVSSLLIVNYWQVRGIDTLEHPDLARLRSQVTGSSETDAETIDAIRNLDLLARAAFFTSQRMLRIGGLLALIAGLTFAAALRVAANCRPRLPAPTAETPQKYYWTDQARARELLMFMGGLWLFAALLAAVFTRLDIPLPTEAELAAAEEEAIAAPEDLELVVPSWEEALDQWPSFRGPGGYGVARHTNAPTSWDVASGKNIRWKVAPPLPGFNSPVVWGDRVYLSGADEDRREVYAFDADTGDLLWRTPIGTRIPVEPPRVNDDTGWAAPTVAAQGNVVCAVFGTGHLACLDHNGGILWEKHLGVPDNHYGHSSSLIIYEDLLIVQYDQRQEGALFAFDLRDGTEVWKQERERISWASPILVGMPDAPLLVVVSTRDMDVYNPRTGALLWSVDSLAGEVGPSPAYGAGLFFVANEYADASAIRLPDADADGDAEPEILWQFYESLPDVASPLATDTFFYLLTSRGEIVWLRPEDGEIMWVHEHDEPFYASPILVGNRIYAIDMDGRVLIFENAEEYKEIARPTFEETTVATPAFVNGRIYARTETSLICIEEQ